MKAFSFSTPVFILLLCCYSIAGLSQNGVWEQCLPEVIADQSPKIMDMGTDSKGEPVVCYRKQDGSFVVKRKLAGDWVQVGKNLPNKGFETKKVKMAIGADGTIWVAENLTEKVQVHRINEDAGPEEDWGNVSYKKVPFNL